VAIVDGGANRGANGAGFALLDGRQNADGPALFSGTPGRTRTCDLPLRRHTDLAKNIEKSEDRDGVVTAIVGALSSAAAREPQALSRCVEALGLALGALMDTAVELPSRESSREPG
jgi:hypothetical protein